VSLYKIILISLLFFCLSNISFAQFDASIWAGVNSSSFGGNPPKDANYESIYGLAFGGNFDYHFTEEVVIALEPSFEQSGSDIVFGSEEKLLDTVITYSVKQNYFGLGLLFKINTERFYVGAGLNFQLLSSANLEHESTNMDIKDKFLDYNIISFFNVGYKIPLGSPTLFIELRYLQGLVNIYSGYKEYNSDKYIANFKSTGLRLSTGIMFPL
jgi:hypothetical protein